METFNMKEKIKIAVNYKVVNSEEQEIDFPGVSKYYSKNDIGRFFPQGEVLFGILVKHPESPWFTLIKVTRNKQEFTDFQPKSDCNNVYWLSESGLRKEAFEILTPSFSEYKEITEEEFNIRREKLLNDYKNDD